jgi:Fe2+ or Zn2+ uptake regulation protein
MKIGESGTIDKRLQLPTKGSFAAIVVEWMLEQGYYSHGEFLCGDKLESVFGKGAFGATTGHALLGQLYKSGRAERIRARSAYSQTLLWHYRLGSRFVEYLEHKNWCAVSTPKPETALEGTRAVRLPPNTPKKVTINKPTPLSTLMSVNEDGEQESPLTLQEAVLQWMANKGTPVTYKDVLEKFGETYHRPSVANVLYDLDRRGSVRKLYKKNGLTYYGLTQTGTEESPDPVEVTATNSLTEDVKSLREEVKSLREEVKSLREEVAELRNKERLEELREEVKSLLGL